MQSLALLRTFRFPVGGPVFDRFHGQYAIRGRLGVALFPIDDIHPGVSLRGTFRSPRTGTILLSLGALRRHMVHGISLVLSFVIDYLTVSIASVTIHILGLGFLTVIIRF